MKKKVTIEVEIESDYLSSIHRTVGDLVSEIEDNDLVVIKAVSVDDVQPLKLPGLGQTYRG